MSRILLVDDEPAVLWLLSELFETQDHEVLTAQGGIEALRLLQDHEIDLVLLDLRMPKMDGLEVLKRMRASVEDSLPAVIMTSEAESIKTAIYALRLGAYDYVAKPFNVDELAIVIKNALHTRRLERQVTELKERLHEVTAFDNIVGKSEPMQKIYGLLRRVAGRDVTVFILGESGTGKELIAQALHQHSQRADGPFVAVDCGTLPEQLIESELFGYEKGAFTGADRRRIGKFEAARGGTLFFDEIGNISVNLQSRLLRAIETNEITRLGGTTPIRTDVRLVAATNVDIPKAVKEGTFREDLYYRLNVISIELPPLRDRRDDIPLLVDHFLALFKKRHERPDVAVSKAALKAFYEYDWPGNVRELRNIVERAVILADGAIGADILPTALSRGTEKPLTGNLKEAGKESRRIFEMERIRKALEATKGNKTKAAKLLGISVKTLYNRLRKAGETRDK